MTSLEPGKIQLVADIGVNTGKPKSSCPVLADFLRLRWSTLMVYGHLAVVAVEHRLQRDITRQLPNRSVNFLAVTQDMFSRQPGLKETEIN